MDEKPQLESTLLHVNVLVNCLPSPIFLGEV